jgi:hypothetical protein
MQEINPPSQELGRLTERTRGIIISKIRYINCRTRHPTQSQPEGQPSPLQLEMCIFEKLFSNVGRSKKMIVVMQPIFAKQLHQRIKTNFARFAYKTLSLPAANEYPLVTTKSTLGFLSRTASRASNAPGKYSSSSSRNEKYSVTTARLQTR